MDTVYPIDGRFDVTMKYLNGRLPTKPYTDGRDAEYNHYLGAGTDLEDLEQDL